MTTPERIINYLKWRKTSYGKHGYGIHSPFLFHLITQVLHKKISAEWPGYIENRRNQLLHDFRSIEVIDFGSGNKSDKNPVRQVCKIARRSSSSAKDGRLLYQLANYLQCKNILELGTNFGLGTSYLAHTSSAPKIITIEGCPNISSIASDTFNQLQLKNIRLITGEFTETLAEALNTIETLDLVFFDGNHRYQPTLEYFTQCLPKINNRSVFIFDDIHQSFEMEKAWNKIIKNKSITLSLDFYWMGVVFFRRESSKEHFCLRR